MNKFIKFKRAKEKAWRLLPYECFYCGLVVDRKSGTIDHFKPKKVGGSDDISNLVISCKSCNESKGCRMPTWEETQKHIDLLTELSIIC